ncbi:MAG: hypothetical protein AAB521_04105 [Patescibacteria group bacterium]|mgnify:FL=1
MEPKSPDNESNLNQEDSSTTQGSKLSQLLKSKFYILFIAITLVVIIFPVLYFSTNLIKNYSSVSPTPAPVVSPSVSPTEDAKPTLAPFPSKGDYVENQLIVEYKEGMSPEELLDNDERSKLADSLTELGVTLQEKISETDDPKLKNFYVLTFKDGIDVEAVSSKIYAIPQIKGVEPNGKVGIF